MASSGLSRENAGRGALPTVRANQLILPGDAGEHDRLGVSDVNSERVAPPEPIGHLRPAQLAPALRDVTFVPHLVPHHRLQAVTAGHDGGRPILVPLQAYVLVDGSLTPVRVLCSQRGAQRVPDRCGPRLGTRGCECCRRERCRGPVLLRRPDLAHALALAPNEVPFVCQGPPHVGKGGEPRHRVPHVLEIVRQVVRLRVAATNAAKAPMIVGMKQDEVGDDAGASQLLNRIFQVAPEGQVEARKVPIGRWRALVGVESACGLLVVVRIPGGMQPGWRGRAARHAGTELTPKRQGDARWMTPRPGGTHHFGKTVMRNLLNGEADSAASVAARVLAFWWTQA
eukprot:scaffold9555_cov123-Isochrysis_galbana.AAC.4